MSDEPNQPREPNANNFGLKIFGLLLAFSPISIILVAIGVPRFHVSVNLIKFIIYGINPIITIFGCCLLFWKPDGNKILIVTLAILLGAVLAVLNALIALFAACAMHPFNLNG
jgi:hypothetical protein